MTPHREERIAQMKQNRFSDLIVVIESVDDPHNLGAILRSCDAVGVGEVCLVYPIKPPRMHELRTKAAASAAKWLKIKTYASSSTCAASLHRRGFQILVAALDANGKPQWDWDLKGRVAIVVGNEHMGVSPELLKKADGVITIPMRGMVQSLNVSVATAVILEEVLRQRIADV